MKLEVLLSCMNQNDFSIVARSGITSDVLVLNQCNQEDMQEIQEKNRSIRKIDTKQRGLSHSRNMALAYASGDVCLLCDDDESFQPDYETKILKAFRELPQADIIIFRMDNYPCKLKKEVFRLRFFDCLRVSSWQIAFRREKVVGSGVCFDPMLGAGSGNGGGEEVKFLLDCYRKGLKIYYVPVEIASVAQEESTWFFGFDKKFFYQRGTTTRYILGLPVSVFYAFYYVFTKKSMYESAITPANALTATLSGIMHNDIAKQKER